MSLPDFNLQQEPHLVDWTVTPATPAGFFGVFLLVQDGANSFAPFQKEVYEGVFGANIDAAVNLRQGLEDSISIGIESWKF